MIVVCGLMLLIAANQYSDQEFVENFEPVRKYQKIMTKTIMIVALVVIVTGLWGVAAYKVKQKLFIITYGLAVAALTAIMTGFEQVFDSLANMSDDQMKMICPGADSELKLNESLLIDLESSVVAYDGLNDVAKYFMCSPTCPCLTPEAETIAEWNEFQDWFRLQEDKLNVRDRTKESEEVSAFIPMVFMTADEAEEAEV